MVMDNVVHIIYVKPPRPKISRHQDRGRPVVEEVNCQLAFTLLQAAMVKPDGKMLTTQVTINPFSTLTVVDKHQRTSVGQRPQQVGKRGQLVALRRIDLRNLQAAALPFA